MEKFQSFDQSLAPKNVKLELKKHYLRLAGMIIY